MFLADVCVGKVFCTGQLLKLGLSLEPLGRCCSLWTGIVF